MKRPFGFVTSSFTRVLAWLLALDFAFIIVNVVAFGLAKTGVIDHIPLALKITEDREFPEDYNYLKWAVIIIALVWLACRERMLAPLTWAGVFAMILADDSMQIHEWLGEWLAANLKIGSTSVLEGRDFGEMYVFFAMAGIAAVLLVAQLLRRESWPGVLSVGYVLVLAGLGVFGVGVDALHQVVTHLAAGRRVQPLLSPFFGMVEDGGEMVVASAALALTIAPPFIQTPRVKQAPQADLG